ncbi:hypothetical protein BGLT_05210 [Caballeronia glathei]|uniref:Uncharacterized protein n=1 Tax=Caballeronia glathei TaxID=60547 RepID=A0A069PPI6_9BURK|nr:hypothetical protein [Caballeronia glathei]KDR39186.1 hypothetical protein BG61_34345 [Caballeronia glathei]CDY76137.1 hypothetical protein BGLT_05210 [Caballeronia glathei]
MSRRAEFRNEVKTRLEDPVYEGMQAYKALYGIDSDSAALARITKLFLFGTVGTLPANLLGVSADVAQNGSRIAA